MKNTSYFKTWSAPMAYIVGFITADGIVFDRGCLRICLHPKDKEILEFIRNEIYPEAQIKIYKQIDKKRNKVYDRCELNIYSIDIVRDLIHLGITPRKTGKETIPTNLPDQYFGDYLRGLFDGDGTVGSYKTQPLHCGLCSASKSFLLDLRNKIDNIGNINPSGNIYSWNMSTLDALKFKDVIYTGGFALQRKKEQFDNFNINALKRMEFDSSEIQYIQNNYQLIKYKDLAKELGRSRETIQSKIAELGLSEKENLWTEEEVQKLDLLLKEGKTKQEIANILNRTPSSVQHKINRCHLRQLRRRWTKEENDFILQNQHKGLKYLSEQLGRSYKSVNTQLWRLTNVN